MQNAPTPTSEVDAAKKPFSDVGDLQTDVNSGLITQEQMDAALAQKKSGQPMLEFKRRLDAAKSLALADPTSYRRDAEGKPIFGALGEEVVTDPDAYGKNFQRYLKQLQRGELEPPTAAALARACGLQGFRELEDRLRDAKTTVRATFDDVFAVNV